MSISIGQFGGGLSDAARRQLNAMAESAVALNNLGSDGSIVITRAGSVMVLGVDIAHLVERLPHWLPRLLARPVSPYTSGVSLEMQPCDARGVSTGDMPISTVYAMPDRVSSAAPLTTSDVVTIIRATDGYWHLHSPPAAVGHIEARIVSSSAAGANRWTYEFVQVVKTSAGYGGWSDVPGGLEGVAYNRNEDRNTGAAGSVNGNGVAQNSLTTASAEFTLRPIPDDTLVELRPLTLADGTVEYWMEIPNGIDGGCLNVS